MTAFHLATIAINQTPLDWSGNRTRILAALAPQSFANRPDIVLFPELSISGYGCEDAFHAIDTARRSLIALAQIARESRRLLPGTLIALGLPVRHEGRIFNCQAFVLDGRLVGLVPKRNLAGDGVHYEPRWFVADREVAQRAWRPGPEYGELPAEALAVLEIESAGQSDAPVSGVPFGPLLIEHRGVRLCAEICEDAWVSRGPAGLHAGRELDLVLNPNASHFAFDKYKTRREIALATSRSRTLVYAQINLLGCEAGRMIFDGHSVVAAAGEVLYENTGFALTDHITNEIALNLNRLRTHRARFAAELRGEAQPETGEYEQRNPLVRLRSAAPSAAGDPVDSALCPEARTSYQGPVNPTKETQFGYAVTLGLLDYLRRSRSRGFVVSLSGGADSACCALLVQRMIARAVREPGAAAFLERIYRGDLLAEFQQLPAQNNPEADASTQTAWLCERLLYTIYQGTAQSSDTTRNAAAGLARALGSSHSDVDVQELMDGYRARAEQVLKRELSWAKDDLALQNIQARVRSPMAWMLANTTGSLLITTSNRSEAAVGYCTMDGDTSGGLAPIGGADKAFVQHWLRYMQREDDGLGGPVTELAAINEQAPTAELRPLEQKQSDEADLMPYVLLNEIEALAVRDRKSPREVYATLLATSVNEANSAERALLRSQIRRFFELWSRNQWKRERYAPAFHLDDRNLDPRTWYRFPILSAGYADELRELDSLD